MTAPVIDWSATQRGVLLSDSRALVLYDTDAQFDLAVNGALQIGSARVSGQYTVALQRADDGSRQWAVTATNARVDLQAGDAHAAITGAHGTLLLRADGQHSGELTGSGVIEGVAGLSATGTLSARFNQDTLELAGALALQLGGTGGMGEVSGQFSVVKAPASYSVPVVETQTAEAGTLGSSTELVLGGQTTTTLLRWTVMPEGGRIAREGVYRFSLDGQTVTVSTLAEALPVSDEVLAQRVQAALARLSAIGEGNVRVSGTRADGFSIEFVGARAGQSVALAADAVSPGLWMEQPADPADKTDWGVIEQTLAVVPARNEVQVLALSSDGTAGQTFTLTLDGQTTAAIPVLLGGNTVNERQVITLSADHRASGQFWLTVDGQDTAKVRYSADPTYHASQMQLALERVLGRGNVTVTYNAGYTGHNSIDYVVDFKGTLAGRDVPLLEGHTTSDAIRLKIGAQRNGSPGYSLQDQARQISRALDSTLGAGSVTVGVVAGSTSLADARFELRFGGALAAQDLLTLRADTASSGLRLATSTRLDGSVGQGAVQTIHL
jgi:hypothetical protein